MIFNILVEKDPTVIKHKSKISNFNVENISLHEIRKAMFRGEILLKSGKFWTMDTMDWTDRMIHKVGSMKRRMMKQSRAELCGWSRGECRSSRYSQGQAAPSAQPPLNVMSPGISC